MSARDDILGRIRAALATERAASPEADAPLGPDAWAAAQRCPETPKGDADLGARFVAKARQVSATCVRVAGLDDVPAAVDAYLHEHGLAPASLIVAAALDALPWTVPRAPAGSDWRLDGWTSVTPSFAAIAETGSVVCLSSAATPAALNFIPEQHIVVVRRSAIVATMEAAWARLRAAGGAMPRAVNVITGPSRTADVEQTVQVGVHGPRRVHLIVCDDA
ncbi:LutC/YkgG family protein [Burkholderia alba]|uniref:LutC/YkgG family protein n=1 Tax=Burkholderia alba TaxID=2683677 RepID=UPI002B05DD20|nr:LUD domain-containing protein [Burkholderia alba]